MDQKKIVVAGAGTMGASLAIVYAAAGYSVSLWNRSESGLKKAEKLIGINLGMMLKEDILKGELSGSIEYTTSLDALKDSVLLEETIAENMETKHEFLAKASRIVPEDALIGTNTSGLRISEVAKAVYRPSRFMGQHWLNPPHLLPLCEIIRGEETDDVSAERMYELVLGLGKNPVMVKKDINGFVINRLQFALLREALYIVEQGIADAQDVDTVFKAGLGLRYAALGPFGVADFGGLDTFDKINKYLNASLSRRTDGDPLLDEMVSKGLFGVKSGAGFYDYSGDRADEAIKERDRLYIELAKVLYYGS